MNEFKLGDLFKFKNGKSSLSKKETKNGDIPIHGSRGIIGYTNESLYDNSVIIIARVGKYAGRVHKTYGKSWITDNAIVAKSNNKYIRSDYAFYLLDNMNLEKYTGGSAQSLLTQSSIKRLKVKIPNLREQKKISELLNNIDNKIKNNNELSTLLEETANSIYESWFEAYEPYKNYKKTEDNKNIPNKFKYKKLSDVLEFKNGYSYSSEEITKNKSEGESPMINLGNIIPNGGFNSDNMKYLNSKPKDRYKTKSGDLIIAHTDMTQDRSILGTPIIVPNFDSENIYFSLDLYTVRNSILPNEYLYFYFISNEFKKKAEKYSSGTTVIRFSNDILSQINISVPPKKELDKYVRKVKPLLQRKLKLRQENNNLKKLRDYLLPLLLNGNVKINNENENIRIE